MSRKRDLAAEILRAVADEQLQHSLNSLGERLNMLRAAAFPDRQEYEALRREARRIKEETIAHLDKYLAQLRAQVEAQGGKVFLAQDGTEAAAYITQLASARGVSAPIVKAKSMTAEEIELNRALIAQGLQVLEVDLGERIIQLAGEKPAHIIGPAFHKSKEEVRRLFARWLEIPEGDIPQGISAITALARSALRQKFLQAEMGITGVNFAVAETGTIVLVENEGDIRMTTRLPPLHVALMGLEKVIPTLDDLRVFLELLPRSGTGQKLTSYVSLLTGPRRSSSGERPEPEREFHLVLLDNGRSRMRADPALREALYCIRCGACMNTCAPYLGVGGHVYGGQTYMSGIGNAWEAGVHGLEEAAGFNELCTTCGRCTEVCPVKIDIPWLNTVIRQRAGSLTGRARWQRWLIGRVDLSGRWGSYTAPLSNWLVRAKPLRLLLEKVLALDRRRRLPAFRRPTLEQRFRRHRPARSDGPLQGTKVALLPDCFTNYYQPEIGLAAIELLERLGCSVELAPRRCCGRGLLSQGLIEEVKPLARRSMETLERLAGQGYELVGVEPSCLAALRGEYAHIIGSKRAARLRPHLWEILEYLQHCHLPPELFAGPEQQLVYHGHCQQKAIGANRAAISLLANIPGVKLKVVEVPCCGMAGSFGYKRDFYQLSMQLGRRLTKKLEKLEGQIVLCGSSCRAQVEELSGRSVRHPLELLLERLKSKELSGPGGHDEEPVARDKL